MKAPKTATVILIPRLESLRDVKISEPKKVISIKIEIRIGGRITKTRSNGEFGGKYLRRHEIDRDLIK